MKYIGIAYTLLVLITALVCWLIPDKPDDPTT